MRRLGVIGAGGMAATVLSALAANLPAPLDHLSLLTRGGSVSLATGDVARATAIRTDLAAFLADDPDLVVECAGHAAVRAYGPAVLRSGCDLIIISIGALADDALRADLERAAQTGGARVILPPGAVGGIDALAAARLSGLLGVVYTGRKPPEAWRGTQAERLLDLDALTAPAIFFEGSARDAAGAYPQNANVAATVALAGMGFDATRVRLIADPTLTRNVHEVAVRAACADFTIRLDGHPSPANPKTSLTAGYSVARAVLNRVQSLVI
jgi:aspartate dehydrogenase